MTATKQHPGSDAPAGGGGVARLAGPGRLLALTACALLLASVIAAPAIAPYHIRVRGVYITLAPLTAGFLFGVWCSDWARKRMRWVMAGSVLVLLAALLPRLRQDLPAGTLVPMLLTGPLVAMVFVRLGLLQAGIGWGSRGPEEPPLPRWMAVFAYAFAWAWLSAAIVNPRESSPPTRWLLTAIGSKPSSGALAPARVLFRQSAVSGRSVRPERGRTEEGGYVFAVGPLVARPGEIMASVTAARRDGAPFERPMWLTLDADDARRPDASNDHAHFEVSTVDGGTPEGEALRRSASARRFTTYAWYGVTQSLPSVRLRARLWAFEGESDAGDLLFRPVAEVDLGEWDLTVMSRLRAQPVGM